MFYNKVGLYVVPGMLGGLWNIRKKDYCESIYFIIYYILARKIYPIPCSTAETQCECRFSFS